MPVYRDNRPHFDEAVIVFTFTDGCIYKFTPWSESHNETRKQSWLAKVKLIDIEITCPHGKEAMLQHLP